ncbi:MAG: ATP phosphoribosyltransferase regulatory subunit [Clostridia bacterium]|nr:ATP phosphoribosyltransferase regulatory subunit [Clostridia bacterium]
MQVDTTVIKNDEKAIFALRALYEMYGYVQYKMNKFEEYDLYVRNKDFLVSENIITFTDADRKLMALKPDVTLSIIKNGSDEKGGLQKVYYNENIYRVPKGTHAFKEIMQTGLECIGDIDAYCVFEVLSLAAKSLAGIASEYVLDVSHMGVIAELLNSLSITDSERAEIIKCIGEKNTHDIAKIAGGEKLQKLISAYGSTEKVLPVLEELYPEGLSPSAKLLISTVSALEKEGFAVRIDFSVLNDMSYYSGIVFKGFVSGIPSSILSGGQYDYLMRKMNRKANAIGFAVYLDMLEQLNETNRAYDVDTVILYDAGASLSDIYHATRVFTENGKSVLVRESIHDKIRYRQLVHLNEKGAFTIEENA